MRELQAGLWHWQVVVRDRRRCEILELAADREPVVVLTAPWRALPVA